MTFVAAYKMPSQRTLRVPPIDFDTDSAHLWAEALEELPEDPRLWSRQNVSTWLTKMAATHKIADLKTDRFPMNGKALCLMTIEMYQSRVPLGGKMLFRDFQIRLAKALYKQECNMKKF